MDEPKVPVGNTNRYLRLIYRYRLVVPPGTNIKVTIRYLWRASQMYRYQFISIPVLLGWMKFMNEH